MPGMLEDIIEHTKEAAGRYLSQPHTRVSGVQVGQRGGLARQYNQIVHFHSLSSIYVVYRRLPFYQSWAIFRHPS